MRAIMVLGATSAIAQAFCRACAVPETRFWLLGRNAARLQIVSDDLRARGAAAVDFRVVQPGSFGELEAALEEGMAANGTPAIFLAAQGSLPSQEDCEERPGLLGEVISVNATEIMQGCLVVAKQLERRGPGVCVVLGSVAGDRGRRTNYLYGAAKSALETFCEGLRQRLEPASHVLLMKPGPVDTPMTAQLRKGLLFTTPDQVAADILSAVAHRKATCYSPFYWRYVMAVIRLLPRRLVKRLRA